MLEFIKNTALGGAIIGTIAVIAYAVPHAELLLLLVAGVALAYGIGSIVNASIQYHKDGKRIAELRKAREQRELLNE